MFHTFADEYRIAHNNVTIKQASMTHEDSYPLAPFGTSERDEKSRMAADGHPPDR